MNQHANPFIYNHLQLMQPPKLMQRVHHPEVVDFKGLSRLMQKSASASASGKMNQQMHHHRNAITRTGR